MELNLKQKRCLIAGSTRGIGLAIANAFLLEGAHVWGTARNKPSLPLFAENEFYTFSTCNFEKTDEIKNLHSNIKNVWQNLDCLIFNVGNGTGTKNSLPTEQEFDASFNLNFKSLLNTINIFQDLILKSKTTLVFISSIAGFEYIGAPLEYSISKMGVQNLTKHLAHKFGAHGIRVNSVAPGNILFSGGSWEKKIESQGTDFLKAVLEKMPLGRFGTPEEVSAVVLFLASQKSSFIHGATIVVDGGQTIGF
jgi:3-oxoacyl-[acyl-carrier protein] reductase